MKIKDMTDAEIRLLIFDYVANGVIREETVSAIEFLRKLKEQQ